MAGAGLNVGGEQLAAARFGDVGNGTLDAPGSQVAAGATNIWAAWQ